MLSPLKVAVAKHVYSQRMTCKYMFGGLRYRGAGARKSRFAPGRAGASAPASRADLSTLSCLHHLGRAAQLVALSTGKRSWKPRKRQARAFASWPRRAGVAERRPNGRVQGRRARLGTLKFGCRWHSSESEFSEGTTQASCWPWSRNACRPWRAARAPIAPRTACRPWRAARRAACHAPPSAMRRQRRGAQEHPGSVEGGGEQKALRYLAQTLAQRSRAIGDAAAVEAGPRLSLGASQARKSWSPHDNGAD